MRVAYVAARIAYLVMHCHIGYHFVVCYSQERRI